MDLSDEASASLQIENLGGIRSLEATVPPGVTILSGENATNRTSFLRSIAAALGADETAATLKSDTEEGSVTLEIDDTTATRTYSQSNGTVVRSGEPLSDRPELVDTYAALFATNPARTTIREGGDGLRDVLMRGVDTTAINAKIQSLKQERTSLEAEIKQIEAAQNELPRLREQENSLEDDLEDIQEDISEVETEIENYEATSEEIEEAERHLEKLEDLRDQLRREQNEIERTKESITSLEDKQAEIESSLQGLSVEDTDRDELQSEKQSLEDSIAQAQKEISELNDVISNNQSVLKGDEIFGEFGVGDITEELNRDEETVQCWTCGSNVERSQIQDRIETLKSIRKEKNDRVQDLRQQRNEIQSSIDEIESAERERSRLESELKETKQAIQSEESELERLQDNAAELESEIESVEAEVDDTEELRDSDLPEAYQRLSQLQQERGRIETQLESIRKEIQEKEEQAERKSNVESQLDEIRSELEETRGQIERTEREVVEKFNEQMEDLIDLLGYDNIARVWLDRIAQDGQSSEFEIHLARETTDGAVYDDTLKNLSESEREIIGIVVALSGYLVHDLDETVPFVLFDSVESIDASRLEKLFGYINNYAPFIVTALLPEDAATIDQPVIEAPAFEGARP